MNDKTIIAYLLGDMTEAEQEAFEDECFAADEWPDIIGLVEAELIDDYLGNRLTAAQRIQFEKNYAVTPARQRRIAETAALLRHVDEATSKPLPVQGKKSSFFSGWSGFLSMSRPVWQTAGIVLVVVLALACWIYRSRPQPISSPITLILAAKQRGAESNIADVTKIKLSSAGKSLRFILLLPTNSSTDKRYEVILKCRDGGEEQKFSPQAINGRLELEIPTDGLETEGYSITPYTLDANNTAKRVVDDQCYYFDIIE